MNKSFFYTQDHFHPLTPFITPRQWISSLIHRLTTNQYYLWPILPGIGHATIYWYRASNMAYPPFIIIIDALITITVTVLIGIVLTIWVYDPNFLKITLLPVDDLTAKWMGFVIVLLAYLALLVFSGPIWPVILNAGIYVQLACILIPVLMLGTSLIDHEKRYNRYRRNRQAFQAKGEPDESSNH